MTPEEVASIILSRLKETAQSYLGQTVSSAVIAVPARFNGVYLLKIIFNGDIFP